MIGDKTMAGFRPRIFGKRLVVNLNAKRGFRVSPGANARANAIKECAKDQSLTARKDCFALKGNAGSNIPLSSKPSAVKARAKYAAKKGR